METRLPVYTIVVFALLWKVTELVVFVYTGLRTTITVMSTPNECRKWTTEWV